MSKKRVVVLISGSGSNLQAILEAGLAKDFPAEIVGVISNISGVFGLERAAKFGIPGQVVSHKAFATREAFDEQLALSIDAFKPNLVVLAGFMRILTPSFVAHYLGRLINIHPSLLPKYPGLHTHRRALEAGDDQHGATVHFVTPELDGGPPIIQASVAIYDGDDESTLAARVLEQEHKIYPLAIKWFCGGNIKLDGNKAILNGEPLPESGFVFQD